MRAWTSADKCRAYRRIQLLVDQLAARYFHNKFSTKTAAYTTPVSDENAFQLEKQTVHHIVFIMSVWDTGVDGVGGRGAMGTASFHHILSFSALRRGVPNKILFLA